MGDSLFLGSSGKKTRWRPENCTFAPWLSPSRPLGLPVHLLWVVRGLREAGFWSMNRCPGSQLCCLCRFSIIRGRSHVQSLPLREETDVQGAAGGNSPGTYLWFLSGRAQWHHVSCDCSWVPCLNKLVFAVHLPVEMQSFWV